MTPVRRKVAAFRLDDDLLEGMQETWERHGVQPSEQVRRALRAWLESKGVKMKAAPGVRQHAEGPKQSAAVTCRRGADPANRTSAGDVDAKPCRGDVLKRLA
jgi:hypothetical protein